MKVALALARGCVNICSMEWKKQKHKRRFLELKERVAEK